MPSQLNKHLHQFYKIKHSITRPYDPRTNGVSERMNQSILRSGISESWERKTVVTKMMWSRKLRSTDVCALTLPLAHRRMKCFFLGNFEWSQVNHKRTRRTNSFACLKKMTRLDEGITQSCEEMSKRFDKIRGVREETQKKIAKEQLRQMESFDARTLNKEELPRVVSGGLFDG